MSTRKSKLETTEEIVEWLRKQGQHPSTLVGVKTNEVDFDCVVDGVLVEGRANEDLSEIMARGHLPAEDERRVREALRFEIFYQGKPNLTVYMGPVSWRGDDIPGEGIPVHVHQDPTAKQKKRSRKLSAKYIEVEENERVLTI